MRIFLAFPGRGNVAVPSSQIWIAHIYPTLRSMGHEVVLFDQDFTALLSDALPPEERERQRTELSDRLLRHVGSAHELRPLDLFLSYFYTGTVHPEVVADVRRLGVLTVNFSCNNLHQFHTVRDIAPLFDYCMVPERAALEKFRAIGARAIHVQMGANPNLFRSLGLSKRYGITFVGAKYADRGAFVAALALARLPVRVWGAAWKWESVSEIFAAGRRAFALGGIPRLARGALSRLHDWRLNRILNGVAGPPLADEDMVRVYNESQIALNFSKAIEDDRPWILHRHIRMRDFEVPMTGIFYMPEYSDELPEYYEIGKEVVTFQSVEELVYKAAYYLKHDGERQLIAAAGHQRAQREHTWAKRFAKLFREIGLIHA